METNRNCFQKYCLVEENSKWEKSISREKILHQKEDEIRRDFARDYTRILHSTAYRRLKHKTQVFFATSNDHICTRIEHVNHVCSVSDTIVKYLGLSSELVTSIAIGHDLGHAPFGHAGEAILEKIAKKSIKEEFWHEKNGLFMVDKIETLPDVYGCENNLSLTYAVRDGIICHCGEIDEESLKPRSEEIDLYSITSTRDVSPFTWEACVVKVADKIAYLGRDIEDALKLNIIDERQINKFKINIERKYDYKFPELTNSGLLHNSIVNLCQNSNPDDGIRFSSEYFNLIKEVKDFNYKNIYGHDRLKTFKDYACLIIRSIFEHLSDWYDGKNTIRKMKRKQKMHPTPLLATLFEDWLIKYTDIDLQRKENKKYINDVVFGIDNEKDFHKAIIVFISGMTDHFAISVFNELVSFR